MIKRSIFFIVILFMSAIYGPACLAQGFHCEADTAEAMVLVREFYAPGGSPSELCGRIAERLVGVPYENITGSDSVGKAEIRIDAFDERTFVNTVAALARTATSPGHIRERDIERNLVNISFRKGDPDGFTSLMIYGADWAVDNRSRGNVKELTEDFSSMFRTKSLIWIGRNRDKFVALGDSAVYDKQRMLEMGFRTFKIPHMKRESTEWKEISPEIKDGDVIMLLTNDPDKDVFETGFVVRRDDGLHFIHVSEKEGCVVEEKEPLGRYIKRNAKQIYGWRWFRIL